jgi:hypothetical protein
MRGVEMPFERFVVTVAHNFKTIALKPFAMTWVLSTSFRVCIHLLIMARWKGRTRPCLRWLGPCLMSIGLQKGSGLRR